MDSLVMITTDDNPYSPFTQFREWYAFDVRHGYHTAERFADLSSSSYALSEDMNEMSDEDAIDELIKANPLIKYRKVTQKDFKSKAV